jgi:excinuclease ABC subunit A
VDPELVVPDESLSLAEGALAPWAGARSEYFTGLQAGVAELGGFDFDAPWKSLKAKDKKLVLYGLAHQAGPRHLQEPLRPQALLRGHLRGHRPLAAAPARRAESDWSREQIEQYMREVDCPACTGRASSPSRWP